MMKLFLSLLLFFVLVANAYSEEPLGKIWFTKPKDGERVKNPVTFCFEAKGFKVVKWSKENKEGEGHHHLLIDVDYAKTKSLKGLKGPIKMIHQSAGTSCHTLKKPLSRGKHVVSGLFTQNNHAPYKPLITTIITIEVVE